MDEQEKDMEHLFRSKLDEFPSPLKLDKEWLKLESSLDVKSFLSFRWNYFNVYYLGTIFSTFCLACTALYFGMKQPKYLLVENKLYKSDTVYVNRIIRDTILASAQREKPGKDGIKLSIGANKPQNFSLQTTNDSIPEAESAKSDMIQNDPEKKVSPKKPVIYQYKRDTIIRYDSIKVSKRKLKKMKRTH